LLAAPVLALAFLGCHAREPSGPPVLEPPQAFSANGAARLADRWWESLGDEELNALVERGLAGNFDLQAAWDRLAQAEAVARREGAALIPSLDAELSTTRTELTQSAAQGSGAGGRNDIRLGIAAAYEIDLWGRLRAGRDAARIDAVARAADVHTAAITLSAEIASAWYELVEQRRQIDVIDEQIRTNERVLELLSLRYRSGLVQASDVLRQRQLVEATRAERPSLEARARVLANLLATLVGEPVGMVALPGAHGFPALLPLPATGLPSEVLARRPDVESAYQAILAADQRLHAAKVDRYPRLSVGGSAAFSAEDARDLFDNWIASVAANLIAPVIDGGRRAAETDRVRAVVSERVHAYGQTVLVALQEVEDAIARERAQRERIELVERQLEISNSVVGRIRDQYLFGASEYLDVLEALSSNQALQRERETVQRELLSIRIDLYRALAGSFELERGQLQEAPMRSSRVEP
jgi:NodT family efflux transporter outer membrane factor (OMF) lipoprotein